MSLLYFIKFPGGNAQSVKKSIRYRNSPYQLRLVDKILIVRTMADLKNQEETGPAVVRRALAP